MHRSGYNSLSIHMLTSSNGLIFRVTGPLCGEFTGHRWILVTKASDAELWCFFYLRLSKHLSKQSRRRWFETPSRPLLRHCIGKEASMSPSRSMVSLILMSFVTILKPPLAHCAALRCTLQYLPFIFLVYISRQVIIRKTGTKLFNGMEYSS